MSSAFGATTQPNIPLAGYGLPYQTHMGIMLPPGGNVVSYVGSVVDGMPEAIRARLYGTLNQALAQCRSGEQDIVVVLPGHTENFSAADSLSNLVAGTQIIGMGYGNNRPTFTWTAAASTVLINVANVTIDNCVLLMAGDGGGTALTVAAPMTVSAAGFSLLNCRIQTSVDADELSTIAITTTAAADDMTIHNCRIHGEGDGTGVTTAIRLVGADRFTMTDSYVDAYTSSTTVGVLQMLTTASTQVFIKGCFFANRKASSVHACTGMAGATGVVADCGFHILDNATLAGWETEGSLAFFGCTTVNAAGEGGAAKTPVSA